MNVSAYAEFMFQTTGCQDVKIKEKGKENTNMETQGILGENHHVYLSLFHESKRIKHKFSKLIYADI